jgi:hypothetical protein
MKNLQFFQIIFSPFLDLMYGYKITFYLTVISVR